MTKLSLSQQEMVLINNSDWILTKHAIIKKVYDFFSQLLPLFQEEVKKISYLFPEEINYQAAKISRGENYQQLPYVILDYPSFFQKNNI